MVHMNKRKSFIAATLLFAVTIVSSVIGQSTAKVQATSLEPASQAAYLFELYFDSDVSPSSQIEIVFPPAFNLNHAVLAASDKLDGTLKVRSDKSSLIINRVKAETPIQAGELVDIKVAAILNPNVMSQDWSFRVIVRDGQREIDQKVVSTAIGQITKENR